MEKKKLFPEAQNIPYRKDSVPLTEEDSLRIYDPRAKVEPPRKLLSS